MFYMFLFILWLLDRMKTNFIFFLELPQHFVFDLIEVGWGSSGWGFIVIADGIQQCGNQRESGWTFVIGWQMFHFFQSDAGFVSSQVFMQVLVKHMNLLGKRLLWLLTSLAFNGKSTNILRESNQLHLLLGHFLWTVFWIGGMPFDSEILLNN